MTVTAPIFKCPPLTRMISRVLVQDGGLNRQVSRVAATAMGTRPSPAGQIRVVAFMINIQPSFQIKIDRDLPVGQLPGDHMRPALPSQGLPVELPVAVGLDRLGPWPAGIRACGPIDASPELPLGIDG